MTPEHPNSPPGGDFSVYERYLIAELAHHSDALAHLSRRVDALLGDVTRLQIQIAGLWARSGVWGLAAGLMGAMAAFLLRLLR